MAFEKKKRKEDPPPSQDWLVTFSDCMTLLLCFFVMLLSFSSFDEFSLTRLEGVMDVRQYEDIHDLRKRIPDSEQITPERKWDHTKHGSDSDVDADLEPTHFPRSMPSIMDADAYKSMKVLRIDSGKLFREGTWQWNQGAQQQYLDKIAKFLHLLPCQVVVSESQGAGGESVGSDLALMRSMEVMKYLVGKSGLESGRFSISASETGAAVQRNGGDPLIEITLISGEVFR